MKTPKIMTVIDELLSYEEHIFRGENNKDYGKVSSKLYREYKDIILDDFSVLDIQKDLIERARPHIRPDASDIEVLTELQHYGGQTALIDFTTNALIALFFACYGEVSKDSECSKDGECSENGRIIVLKIPAVLPKDPITNNDKSPYRIKPSGKSPRVIFQSSVFVQIATGHLEEGSEEDRYKVIKIEQGHKKDFLAYLKQSFGIDADTIYNDIHGFIQNKDNNTTVETAFYRGNSCLKNKQYDLAIADYTKAIALKPDVATVFHNRGIAYGSKGEYELAITDYTQAIALRPDVVETFNNRGNSYAKKGDYDLAIADYTQAIALKPDNAKAFYNRGLAYESNDEYDPAIEDYTKAIALKLDFPEAFCSRGMAYKSKGKYDLAIADCTTAIALRSDFAEAFNHRGMAYKSKGDYELAIADFTQAIALKLDYAEAFCSRGLAYGSKGEYDPAIADFTQAIALKLDFAEAFYHRGAAYTKKGEYDHAIADFTESIALNPDFAGAFYSRGMAYKSKGEYELAIAEVKKAIELFTQQGKIDLANEIELILQELKDKDKD